jgi:sec-independent protein translocase protein TatA
MPFKMGPWELGLILLIVLMVFGVGKLPQVGASLGKAIRAFRQGASASDEEEEAPKRKKRAKRKKATKVAA